jgi:ribose-phosphate pyrophosphokinase
MELLIMTDACKRASAGRITAVLPYYGYARQDRKLYSRAPITSKLVADMLTVAGISRVLTMDLHAGQIQGFFNVPVDNLYATYLLCNHIEQTLFKDNPMMRNNLVIVSPDSGGVERARVYASRLGASLAIIDKRRPAPNVSHVLHVVGDVKDKIAIIVDDMVGTGTVRARCDGSVCMLYPSGTIPSSHRTSGKFWYEIVDRDRYHPAKSYITSLFQDTSGKRGFCVS